MNRRPRPISVYLWMGFWTAHGLPSVKVEWEDYVKENRMCRMPRTKSKKNMKVLSSAKTGFPSTSRMTFSRKTISPKHVFPNDFTPNNDYPE